MKKIIWFTILIVAVLLVVVFLFLLFSPPEKMTQSQKEEAIAQILGRKPNLTDDTPKGNTVYKGKFVSFSYPAAGRIYAYRDDGLKRNTSVLETFSFDIVNPRLILSYSLIDRPSIASVEDIPDVRFRQLDSGYVQKTIVSNNVSGLSFEKMGDLFEKSAFFFKNNREYSISIIGNNYKEVERLFDQVISTLKFNP